MTNFNVVVTAGAEADFCFILDWIRQRSSQGAERLFLRWQEMLRAIETRADSYGLAPESERHSTEVRQAIFKTRHGLPYRALFVIRARTVFIIHVRGPGEDVLTPEQIRDDA